MRMSEFREKVLSRLRPSVRGCWIWTGAANHQGYGSVRFTWHGRRRSADPARLMLENALGRRLRQGECALRKCGDPRCANPKHLRAGTRLDMHEAMHTAGTRASTVGSKNGNARLSGCDVRRILVMLAGGAWTRRAVARSFGVSLSTVDAIANGRLWSHIPRTARRRGGRS